MAPPGSSVMSGHLWQACATWELITVTYLPVYRVLLKCLSTPASASLPLCPWHLSLPGLQEWEVGLGDLSGGWGGRL